MVYCTTFSYQLKLINSEPHHITNMLNQVNKVIKFVFDRLFGTYIVDRYLDLMLGN